MDVFDPMPIGQFLVRDRKKKELLDSRNWHTLKTAEKRRYTFSKKVLAWLFCWVWDQKIFKNFFRTVGNIKGIFGCLWICLCFLKKSWYSQHRYYKLYLILVSHKSSNYMYNMVLLRNSCYTVLTVSCKFSVGSRSLVKKVFSA